VIDPVLANPAWHALRGPQAAVAEGGPLAFRYQPDVALFAALPDDPTTEAWDQLGDVVGPGGYAFLARDVVPPRLGWEQVVSVAAVQMVATSVDGELDDNAQRLSVDDVTEILALVERTEPGPFGPRTIELGEYFGIRDDDGDGALIAMAGERMFPSPYREISAVCTDESHRGKGLAARLVRHLVARIHERGETPILHAREDNANAIRLYEHLGFTHSNLFTVTGYRAPT
jgi:predicted GNAT family acetyltransferase